MQSGFSHMHICCHAPSASACTVVTVLRTCVPCHLGVSPPLSPLVGSLGPGLGTADVWLVLHTRSIDMARV